MTSGKDNGSGKVSAITTCKFDVQIEQFMEEGERGTIYGVREPDSR
jgi:hypothetical protein